MSLYKRVIGDTLCSQAGPAQEVEPRLAAAKQDGGGLPGADAGFPVTYTVDKGQYLQFTQLAELTGSPILSNKPVGVWGAASMLLFVY